jgi:thiol-disulfide isomerase/thioredoxin
MRAKLLCSLLLLGLLFALLPHPPPAQAQAEPERVIIYIFWGESCPYCHQELAFLEELQERYPQIIVRDYEVYYNEDYRRYMFEMLAVHNVQPRGVPVTFIGEQYWDGFSAAIARQIEAKVASCLQTTCLDPGVGIVPIQAEPEIIPEPEAAAPDPDENTITLPLIGEISLAGQSLWLSTALISFVDGFNPCSLWVLSILLALVIHSGSRKKIMIVGLTFLAVTATIYGLFIAGLFSVFSFVGYLGWIQIVVALLALTFAFINIKDYFWYKEGVSLTIDDKHKPKIYRDMRGLLSGERSTAGLIGATAVMAAGIALVELPCTAGFPVLWTNIIAAQEVPP